MQTNHNIKQAARRQVIANFSQYQVALSLSFTMILWQFIYSMINAQSSQYTELMKYASAAAAGGQVSVPAYTQALQNAMPGLLGSSLVNAIVGGILAIGSSWAFVMWRLTKKQPQHPFNLSLQFFRRAYIKDSVILMAVRFIIIFVGYLCFIIPGIIFSLSFAMAPFLYAADVQTNRKVQGVTTYLRASAKMMQGYRLQLLGLNISFIGWAILNSITGGLASVYVVPYYQATLGEFYLARQIDLENKMK